MLRRSRQSGDTLVEVLLSVAILSIVSVGVYALMNRGVSESYGALESSQVRTYINEQTELLTYFRDTYAAAEARQQPVTIYPYTVWTAIQTRATANVSATPASYYECNTVMNNSFYLTYDNATAQYRVNSYAFVVPATLAGPGVGLWIEPVASSGTTIPYIDFYVKACWNPIANSQAQRLSTVVRLYDQP